MIEVVPLFSEGVASRGTGKAVAGTSRAAFASGVTCISVGENPQRNA